MCNLQKGKNPCFFDDRNENDKILPSHLCCEICAKDCQCGQTVNKCKDDTKKHDSSGV